MLTGVGADPSKDGREGDSEIFGHVGEWSAIGENQPSGIVVSPASVKDRNPKSHSWRAPVNGMEFFSVRLAQLSFHQVICTNIQSRLHCPSASVAGTIRGQYFAPSRGRP